MNWGLEDLRAATLLIGGAASAIALICKATRNRRMRWLSIGGVVAAGLATWAHLAVGAF